MSDDRIDPIGEGARLAERLLRTLPKVAVQQFVDSLGARLAMPTPAQQRRERLGSLLAFLHEHGRPPTESEYRDHHDRRLSRGEPSMPLTTLIDHYRSYAEAVNVASRLYARGTASRAPSHTPRRRPANYWTEARCLDAVDTCRKMLGHWPSKWEFGALRGAGSRLTEACEWRGLELPYDPAIKRHFGPYEEMIATAKRAAAWQERSSAAASENPGASQTVAASPSSRKGRSVQRRRRSRNITIGS